MTNNAKHTPGPYHVNAVAGRRIIGDADAKGAERFEVCNRNATVATVYRSHDARLHAAARAAIAKARGEA